jgi:hypothetical protein
MLWNSEVLLHQVSLYRFAGQAEQDYAASSTVQPLRMGLQQGQFGIVRNSA